MSKSEDLTGRDRLARNVIWSWAGHLVFVASGFVMPRMIDHHIGQELLGIWDFCWSLVNYLSIASLGVGSSVNRYVARYRAAGETDHLCRAVSSVVAIQMVIGVAVVVATGAIVLLLPQFSGNHLGPHLHDTRIVVAFLGASLAVQMALDAFRGVITGCHRWDLHNGIQSGSYAVTIIVMLSALAMGGGIVGLSVIYFIGTTLGECLRAVVAMRVCPELQIRRDHVSWLYGRQMVVFGGKVLLLGIPPLLVFQTVNVQVAAMLGPAALAVLSRPLGLVRHSETMMAKFSNMLSPMAGSIRGQDEQAERRKLMLYGTRWSVALATPVSVGLAILGDPLLRIWMGEAYVHPGLMSLLAVGLFLIIAQGSVTQILVGLNLHGKAGLYSASWVMVSLIAGVVVLGFKGWTLMHAAGLMVFSLTPAYGILLPAYLCRRLGISLAEYLRAAFALPVCTGLVLAAVLFGVRYVAAGRPLTQILLGAVLSGLVTVAMYWRYLLTQEQRDRVLAKFPGHPVGTRS